MMIFHKCIKKLAIILAIFLILNIFYFSFIGIKSFIVSLSNQKEINLSDNILLDNMNIYNLDIKLKSSKLVIKNSPNFKIETNNENIKAIVDNKTLMIKEDKYQFFHPDDLEVIIYLPHDILFNEIEIESGFGSIEGDSLQANQLSLELNAGSTLLNSLIVLDKTQIKGGLGEIKIVSGKLTNLNLDMGLGKIEINSEFEENTKIKAGIGEVIVNILDEKDNYTLKLDKGIGNIKVNSEEITDKISGSGDKTIEIKGGIGNILVYFEK